ncbi:MAG: FAD-binding and (Fe-S)-binding domain-containing protein, partial [Candidatus Zixiibacteriota bacterium]
MPQLSRKATLSAYSSDASIYSLTPREVISVRSRDDVVDALRKAEKTGGSVTARGGGTGLSGGAVGDGFILDFSNFRSILDIDPVAKTVATQVGIIYDELNLALRKHHLFFPPDPSSGDSCQIGGMLANNSSGPRSVKYGLTSDFVEEMDVILSDGRDVTLRPMRLNTPELSAFLAVHTEFKAVLELLRKNSALIKSRWPRLKKNSSGYNLLQVVRDLDNGVFNIPALLVGSEGTLALFTSCKLRLRSIPAQRLTARLYFRSLFDAGSAVEPILALAPSGLEIVDGSTLDLIGREKFGIPNSAAAMLLVEFDENMESSRPSFEELADRLALSSPPEIAEDSVSTAALWRARKAIVPTLYRHHPKKRPVPLVEDVSLPPEQIPSFIKYITELFDSHRLTYGVFGHIGDGNLHIRPLFDLNDKNDMELAVRLYDQIYDQVISLGGSSTAEHADGRLRAPLVRKIYGEEIYQIFARIKQLLDPKNILSPGVILSDAPFTAFIDYDKIKLYCAACGKCNGYCPAYDYFRREDFSPRGWLRMINQSGEERRNLSQYLQYCLNCKNCATVCPAGVDISAEIIKFRAIKPSFISKAAVGFTDTEPLFNLSLKLGKVAQPLLGTPTGKKLTAILGGRKFGFDSSVKFPSLAKRTLRQRHPERISDDGEVALFHGCADNLLASKVGDAIFTVFDRLGVNVSLPPQKCCGLPQEVYGHRASLIEKAKYNLDRLEPFKAVITGCASCLLKLKEYPH